MTLPYTRLNPNTQRSKGEGKAKYAPHKPLLLLCLCDLAEEGLLSELLLYKTAELRLRFDSYCALTDYGAHTRKGHSIVEAAHIHTCEKPQQSTDNGLALSPDAHWMFDKGLWTSDDQHRILVADEVFTEWGPEAEWLKARHKQPLRFADGVQLRPSIRHLTWHREQVFSQA